VKKRGRPGKNKADAAKETEMEVDEAKEEMKETKSTATKGAGRGRGRGRKNSGGEEEEHGEEEKKEEEKKKEEEGQFEDAMDVDMHENDKKGRGRGRKAKEDKPVKETSKEKKVKAHEDEGEEEKGSGMALEDQKHSDPELDELVNKYRFSFRHSSFMILYYISFFFLDFIPLHRRWANTDEFNLDSLLEDIPSPNSALAKSMQQQEKGKGFTSPFCFCHFFNLLIILS